MFREVGSSSDWSIIVLALGAALGVAYVLAAIMARLSRASLLYLFDGDRASEAANLVVQRPTRIVRAVVFVLVMAVLVRPTLNLVGLRPTFGVESRALMAWLFDSGLRIVLLINRHLSAGQDHRCPHRTIRRGASSSDGLWHRCDRASQAGAHARRSSSSECSPSWWSQSVR